MTVSGPFFFGLGLALPPAMNAADILEKQLIEVMVALVVHHPDGLERIQAVYSDLVEVGQELTADAD